MVLLRLVVLGSLLNMVAGLSLPIPTSALSACVISCLKGAATSAGCSSFTDVSCVCPSPSFQNSAASCLQACSSLDRTLAVGVMEAICATYDGALTVLNDLTSDPLAASQTLSAISTSSVVQLSSVSALSASSTRSVGSSASIASAASAASALAASGSNAALSSQSSASTASAAAAASLSSLAAAQSASSASGAAAAAAATVSQPFDAQTASSASSHLSSGAISGIVGGVLGGLLILILLALFCFFRQKKRRERTAGTRLDLDWDSPFDPYAHEHRGLSDSLLDDEPTSEAALAVAPWLAHERASGSGSRPGQGGLRDRPLPVPRGSGETEMRYSPSGALISPYNVTPFTPPSNDSPFGFPAAAGATAQQSPSTSGNSIYRTRRATSLYDRSLASASGAAQDGHVADEIDGEEADIEPMSPDSSDAHFPPSAMFLYRTPSANGAALDRRASMARAATADGIVVGGGRRVQRNPSVAAQQKAKEAFERYRVSRDSDLPEQGEEDDVGDVVQHTDGGPLPVSEEELRHAPREVPPRYDMIPDPSRALGR